MKMLSEEDWLELVTLAVANEPCKGCGTAGCAESLKILSLASEEELQDAKDIVAMLPLQIW